MITALATVVSVHQNGQSFEVGVSCEQQTSCSHCSSQKNCGTGIISKAVGNKNHKWLLNTDKQVEVGQIVEIGLPEKKLVQFASLVYLLPLAALFIGALFGQFILTPFFDTGEGLTIVSSVVFMTSGIWITRKLATKIQSESEQSVLLLRVMGKVIEVNSH